MCQLGETVAAHDQTQSEPAVAHRQVGAFIDERVVDAPLRLLLLRRLDQRVAVERHVPWGGDAALGDRSGSAGIQGGAYGFLRQPLTETIRSPVGAEPDLHFLHVAGPKVPHDPLVGIEGTVAQQTRERLGSTRFQLDKAPRAIVETEARRLTEVGRPPLELRRQPPGLRQRRPPIHVELELHKGERPREVEDREGRTRQRHHGKRHPEDRSPEHEPPSRG